MVFMEISEMRVLFVAARETTYARNEVLLRALRQCAQVDVIAPTSAPKSLVKTSAAMAWRALGALRTRKYDLVFCGFYGYLIAQMLRRSTLLRGTPLLFDAFVSNYDTLVQDRGNLAAGSLSAQTALWLDRSTCALADHILLDTRAHADYFSAEVGVPAEKITAIPVGCSETLFHPTPAPHNDITTVLYYASFQPLHGVDIVLRSADRVRGEPLHFVLIGDGPLREEMGLLAQALRLENVEFRKPVPPAEIAAALQQAEVCLGGHFGASGKAQRTIPGKLYQMLAAERAAICADSLANRELLVDGESALLIPAGDPDALAEALLRLHRDPALRDAIARGGRKAYEDKASEAVIAGMLREVVKGLGLGIRG